MATSVENLPQLSQNIGQTGMKSQIYDTFSTRASSTGIVPQACVSEHQRDGDVLCMKLRGFVITRKTPLNTIA